MDRCPPPAAAGSPRGQNRSVRGREGGGGDGRVRNTARWLWQSSVFTLSSEKPVMGCEKRGRPGGTLVRVGE